MRMRLPFLEWITLALALTLFTACEVENPGFDPPRDTFFYPTALALSPDGRTLFVSNGNSDVRYNGSTVLALDASAVADAIASGGRRDPEYPGERLIEESALVRHSARVPSFAGSMVAVPAGPGAYRLFVVTRSGSQVVWLDVHTDSEGHVTCMDCGSGCPDRWPQDCSEDHTIGPDDGLPDDPLNIFYDEESGHVLLTHLTSPYVTVIDPETAGIIATVHIRFSSYGSYVGTYDVVRLDGSTLLVTASYGAEIAVLRGEGEAVPVPYRLLSVRSPAGPLGQGVELRGMAVLPDGTVALVGRTPPFVATFRLDEEAVQLRRIVLDTLSFISERPTRIYALGGERPVLFALAFSSGEGYVYDTHGRLQRRLLVGAGANEAMRLGRWLLVTDFGESTLAVIDADPSSPSFLTRVGRLGTPTELER